MPEDCRDQLREWAAIPGYEIEAEKTPEGTKS